MKKWLLGLSVLILSMLGANAIAANTQEALPINLPYTVTNVTPTAFVQLVASTVKGISGLSVLNLSTAPVQLALGAAGSEVVQLIVPAQSGSTAGPVFYPMSAGYGSRISVESVGTTNSTGSLLINLFYN